MTKEELSKYFYIKREIEQINRKIKEIDCTFLSANKINGIKYERHLSNPQEQRIILIEKYLNELEEKKNEAFIELIKIEKFISSIDDPDVRVIFNYRYVELKSWNEISKLVYMSERTVFYKHNIYLNK